MALPLVVPVLQYPDVNGVRTSYCSISFALRNFFLKGAKAINYKDTGTIPKVKGTSGVPIGRTRGEADSEGDIEIFQEEFDNLLPILTRNGAVGYMETTHPVTVTYAEESQPQKTKTDRLLGVRFFAAEKSNSEGTDALTVKLSLSIMQVMWHGKYVAMRFR